MKITIVRVIMFCGAMVFGLAAGHSFLMRPKSDNTLVDKRHCRRGPLHSDNCGGPCIATTSWQYNKSAAITEWKRGSKEPVLWAMNKHHHGFVRLALVPVAERDSFAAHEQHTFQYTCFETGARSCDAEKYFCGTGGQLYETRIRVPRVEDGVYVLGWAWYGSYATNGRGKVNFHFGDYYSCAYIRIKGGKSVKRQEKAPIFKPGNKEKRCKAMANTRGVCEIEPCPKVYGSGAQPAWMCPKGMEWKKRKCRWNEEGERREKAMNSASASNSESKSKTETKKSTNSKSKSKRRKKKKSEKAKAKAKAKDKSKSSKKPKKKKSKQKTRKSSKKKTRKKSKKSKKKTRKNSEGKTRRKSKKKSGRNSVKKSRKKSKKNSEKKSKKNSKEKSKRKNAQSENKSIRENESTSKSEAAKPSSNERSTKDCRCSVRSGNVPYIAGMLIGGLDAEGRLESSECFCGGQVRVADYPNGFTILVNAVGNAAAVRFVVDGMISRTERVAPFSIGGHHDKMFHRWKPPIGRRVRIEARVLRHRYTVTARFV